MRRLILLCLMGTATAVAAPATVPPPAPVRPVVDDYYGTKVVDDYRYMEDLKDPRVVEWMKAQSEHTRATLDAIPGRAALRTRLDGLLRSVPRIVMGLQIVSDHYYTLQLPSGARQVKLYVRDGLHGDDRLLIDPEKLPGGEDGHLAIKAYTPSPDNHYVAYALAAGGSEQGVLRILDLRTGKDLRESNDLVDSPASWRPDGRSFYYTQKQRLTPAMPATAKYENERVYLHRLGRSFDRDAAIVGRGVSDGVLSLTPRENPVVITAPGSSHAIALIFRGVDMRARAYAAPLASAHGPEAKWRPIAPAYADEFIGIDYDASETGNVALHGDTLYWVSRKNAPRGRILALDLANPASQPVVAVELGDLPITSVVAGTDALYWRVSDAGINSVHRVGYAKGATPELLRLPYPANIRKIITDDRGNGVVLRASSWVRSTAYIGYDIHTGTIADTGLQPSGPADHPEDLIAREVKVKSWDGTPVPLSIVHRKDFPLDGKHPAILAGYGAYGISQDPDYNPVQGSIHEYNVLVATCHVRGGGELGEPWHLAGYQATKPNTWKDFIACAEWLIAHGYTSPGHLAGTGGSAGGILIGRAIEERPDLFAAAIVNVPVADTLRFETTANGVSNVAEFGSVKTEAGFRALYAMSPYANVREGVKYPAVLVTTGINDPRVDAWVPAKLAARLQASTASGKPVLLRVDYAGGHGPGSSIDQAIDGLADEFAFVLWQTGHPDFQPRSGSTD